MKRENIVFLTNIPVPYREKLHEKLYAYYGEKYSVIYCSKIESGRLWKIRLGHYQYQFLSEKETSMDHCNWNIICRLRKLFPKIIILPMELKITFILCIIYAKLHGIKIIYYIDATIDSESHFSRIKILARRLQCSLANAFVCISNGGELLYKYYGIQMNKIFRSRLCADERNYLIQNIEKKYDIIYSCYIVKGKLPFFFSEIVACTAKALNRRIKVLIVGDGKLREELIARMDETGVDYCYAGFASQEELATYYNQSRILVFTTMRDAWGVVANEAMMCGLPVIVSSMAGCANDLVVDSVNGYVLSNENPKLWSEKIVELLNNSTKYETFSQNALNKSQDYTYNSASKGVIEAINSIS